MSNIYRILVLLYLELFLFTDGATLDNAQISEAKRQSFYDYNNIDYSNQNKGTLEETQSFLYSSIQTLKDELKQLKYSVYDSTQSLIDSKLLKLKDELYRAQSSINEPTRDFLESKMTLLNDQLTRVKDSVKVYTQDLLDSKVEQLKEEMDRLIPNVFKQLNSFSRKMISFSTPQTHPVLTVVDSDFFNVQRNLACQNPSKYGFMQRVDGRNAYALTDLTLNWNEAMNFCQTYGARLPVVRNSTDLNILKDFLGGYISISSINGSSNLTDSDPGFWLGGYRSTIDNAWKWIDSTTFTYYDWMADQFNNSQSSFLHAQYCRNQTQSCKWNDTNKLFTICELNC